MKPLPLYPHFWVFPLAVLFLALASCSESKPSASQTKAPSTPDPLAQCIAHERLGMHIHVLLVVVEETQPTTPPANVGITADCMRPLHTHDDSGLVHIEYPEVRQFTLGDFFSIWGKSYEGKEMYSLSVNGVRYEGDWRQVALEDGQRIVIAFRTPLPRP